MRLTPNRRQRGQAMSEFVVAATLLFIPLFMAVVYVGKLDDIQHQAIQASRYAAMERALDPQVGPEDDAVVANETVARFFRDDDLHPISRNEQANEPTAGDENPVWSQLNGDPMLTSYSNVSVTLKSPQASIQSALLLPVNYPEATAGFNLSIGFNRNAGYDANSYGVEADVAVPIANIAHFAPLNDINLSIGASTVIAGNSWNGGGAGDVAGHFTAVSVPGKLFGWIDQLPGIGELFRALAGAPPPQLGCVKPDVVPTSTAPGAPYNPTDVCQ